MFYSRSQNRHKRWYHVLLMGHKKVWAILIVCAFLLVAALTCLIVYTIRASAYDMNLMRGGLQGSVLYDAQQRLVATLSERDNAPVQYAELPEHLVQAFVAREDAHFFDHSGVVLSALMRSMLRNVLSLRYKEGASTITMQLTRHIFELQGKTLDRKLLEIVLAQRVEKNFDKQTILCQYLSRIYFGQNCYGIREAARYFFGKSVSELDLPESAMLAGIVRAPSLYNPKRSPKNARKVRQETLARMLEMEMISQEQFDSADAAPVPDLSEAAPHADTSDPTYPAQWAAAELETLTDLREELGKGVSVMSHMLLPLQKIVESATEEALQAVEAPGSYPQSWREAAEPSDASADPRIRAFTTARRPSWLRPQGVPLSPGQGTLQCCVLVMDSRMHHRGNLLALQSGRNAADGINRWLYSIQPGRTIAPLVFCCACLPGGNSHHIVAHSARVTGSRLGYDLVRTFFDGLALETTLPDRAHEDDLYDGLFPVQRVHLARVLFDLQNAGRFYKPTLTATVWSHAQRLLHTADATAPPEYIRRESAVAVSHLPPFIYHEGEPLILHEELPANDGYWTMVFNDRGVAVFVWMGVEYAEGSEPPLPSKELNRLISHASLSLAKALHTHARKLLRTPAPAAASPAP